MFLTLAFSAQTAKVETSDRSAHFRDVEQHQGMYRRGETPSFLDNLQITEQCHSELRAARTKVRQCLRAEFVKASKADVGFTVRPRFFTQGCFAYRTINDPAWTPPQQMDLDDGAYLPMTFV